MPLEVQHFELMREMGWSFDQLMATPAYVVRYCTDLMFIRREAEAREMEQARKQQGVPGA